MPARPILIFDFDGTLVDSFTMVVEILNRLATKFHIEPLVHQEIEAFRSEGRKSFFPKQEVSKLVMPLLLKEVIHEQSAAIGSLQAVPGLFTVLHRLRQKGYRMGIVSSNSQENVLTYLKTHRFTHLFEFVHASHDLFDKGKVIRDIMMDHQLPRDQVIYVGDETRDIEAARDAGVKVIAVSWGYQYITRYPDNETATNQNITRIKLGEQSCYYHLGATNTFHYLITYQGNNPLSAIDTISNLQAAKLSKFSQTSVK